MAYTAEQSRIYTNTYRAKRRQEALDFLGGKCSLCSATSDLQFDHINPEEKITTIAKMWTASKVSFWLEVRKCRLLCDECHRVRHGKQEHGRSAYQHRGCRCDVCRMDEREWRRGFLTRERRDRYNKAKRDKRREGRVVPDAL